MDKVKILKPISNMELIEEYFRQQLEFQMGVKETDLVPL